VNEPSITQPINAKDSLWWTNLLCGLALFLIPLGHLPLQAAYGCLTLVVFLRFKDATTVFKHHRLKPLLWAVGLYVIIGVLGAWAAGFEGGMGSASRLREHLIVFVFITVLAPMSQSHRLRLTTLMLIGGLVGIGFAWIQFSQGLSPFADLLGITQKQRGILHPAMPTHLAGTGLLYDRIAFSLVSVMLGVFGVSLAFRQNQTAMRRGWWVLIALSLLSGPGLAGSRMGLLLSVMGGFGVLLYVLWQRQLRRWVMGLGLLFFAVLCITISVGSLSKANIGASSHLERNMDRVFIWQRAVEIFVDHPLFGTGYGHYPKVAPMVYHTSDPFRPENNHAHNLSLTLLAETGIVGFFAFFFLWHRWGQAFWRRRKNELAVSAIGSCLVFLCASLVHDPWFHSNLLAVFWWFAALACVVEPETELAS
jgi:hypothetical protein